MILFGYLCRNWWFVLDPMGDHVYFWGNMLLVCHETLEFVEHMLIYVGVRCFIIAFETQGSGVIGTFDHWEDPGNWDLLGTYGAIVGTWNVLPSFFGFYEIESWVISLYYWHIYWHVILACIHILYSCRFSLTTLQWPGWGFATQLTILRLQDLLLDHVEVIRPLTWSSWGGKTSYMTRLRWLDYIFDHAKVEALYP